HRLPFGSGCNAVAVVEFMLFVANGSNNCVSVVELAKTSCEPLRVPDLALFGRLRGDAATSKVIGLIPTGWYPAGITVPVTVQSNKLCVANIKGHGSLSEAKGKGKGKNSHDHLGTVSIIDVPDAAQLAKYTAEVNANNRLAYSLAGLEKPRPDAKPVPVPARHGEPSVFKHVLYVIKENRSYDQILGDVKEGNGDPALCL